MKPLLLHIESATDICSIAVSRGEEILSFSETTKAYQHASRMTLLIEEAMHQSGFQLKDLDGVSVSEGPGSYTSLRVGFSTAKGICYALDKPMVVVPTLAALTQAMMSNKERRNLDAEIEEREILEGKADDVQISTGEKAFPNSKTQIPITPNTYFLPMIDARRMEVYTAIYDVQMGLIKEPHALVIRENTFDAYLSEGKHLVLGGNGAPKCKAVLEHPQIHFEEILCSARHLVPLANKFFEQKQFADVAYIAPFYLKPPNITVSKKKLL